MSKQPKMSVCRNCNAPIGKNARICPSCGAKNTKPFYQKWWFVLLIIIIIISLIGSMNRNKKEKFDWKDVELSDQLPKPKSNVGTIIHNDMESLSMQVEKVSKSEYKDYIDDCKSMGYTVENKRDGDSYRAFNKEGYKISLEYIGETMDIELEAATELGTLKWPKSELANLLPKPKSNVGKVSSDSEDDCYIYVGKTSEDDFNTYIDECIEAGFSEDYQRGDYFYTASDATGNKLSVNYQGNKVMTVQLTKKVELEESEEAVENKSQAEFVDTSEKNDSTEAVKDKGQTESADISDSNDSTELVDGMRPEFKESMDSYEAFYEEYCDFMKAYNENSSDVKLIAKYAKMLKKAQDVDEKFEEWEDGDLNDAELKYYIEVQGRVSQKLLEVADN